MHRARIALSLTSSLALLFALAAAPAAAGDPFARATSTKDGHFTWNTDQIDLEGVSQTGAGVYVAVLDSGLAPNWNDYLPDARVAQELGIGFVQSVSLKAQGDECGIGVEVGGMRRTTYVGSRSTEHGTHVTSIITGFTYRSNSDILEGVNLPLLQVRGVAPEVTIIPVKVLADYQQPALPNCDDPGPVPAQTVNFGTSEMVAAGIDYATDLAISGYRPMVINMSLGGDGLDEVEKNAIDRAIANGVIVVAAAGNEGEAGVHFPGGYAPVISVGSTGWTAEWLDSPADDATNTPPSSGFRYRTFWLKDKADGALTGPGMLHPDSGNVPDPQTADDVYITDFSGRDISDDTELDVLAPGSWVRGPFAGNPGYAHLPAWSNGIGDITGNNPGNHFYVGGTSQSTPHVTGLVALMLQKDPTLSQSDVESILKSSALPIPAGSAEVWDPFNANGPQFVTFSWEDNATGSGLIQADAALSLIP
ncbi:MAG TPA: S8 family serine peptidase [Candidatus Limnocylindrales bacterium]|nr:S8 family serine peptidase [Candidatus Limnocylindrales bacterium]